ncbi:XRE family transcriptional regulator [Echinicola marina]|uniref:helix-turn-helix domain-containing protein n=1 Tax=Echinicola marina TaxID=2859768 RepID=UPI001CF667CC|nr:XRE family transcriptional regulator [Echinicola marina]UCS91965.1 XRE family transcriptional regulator [Echinicola marina]
MAKKTELTDREQKLLKAIGNKMTELRQKENYTNYENFAFDKGINRSQYGKYEAGNVDLRISTLLRVIEKYDGMTLKKFFSEIDFD